MPDMHRTLVFLLLAQVFSLITRAQDTLPAFSVSGRGNGKVVISWRNNYPVVSQISIQRSFDSLKNFTTLITVPDPTLPENGAVDNKAINTPAYYRLFILLENGKYQFSRSKKPGTNTGTNSGTNNISGGPVQEEKEKDPSLSRAERVIFIDPADQSGKPQIKTPSSIQGRVLPEIEVIKTIFVKKGDSVIGQIAGGRIMQYRDSLLNKTKDTLIFIDGDSLLIKPFVPKEVYKISSRVFTSKFGNVQLSLPEASKKKYALKFFDEGGKLLFELSAIKDPYLILDKTNFHHSGWFRFELYEDDQLKEKNRLYIPKEF
ncbi:hypothetical protein ACX0G9_17420 [Flavitalea flava]